VGVWYHSLQHGFWRVAIFFQRSNETQRSHSQSRVQKLLVCNSFFVLTFLILSKRITIPEGTDPLLADLVRKLLIKDPDQRLTAEQMLVK